jgi:hypothetical protein
VLRGEAAPGPAGRTESASRSCLPCHLLLCPQARAGSANEGDGMSERVLPERPNVGQLRRLAKELRAAARAGDPGAVERVRRRVDDDPSTVSLSVAQLVVAREHGFASWPRLTEELEARRVGLAGLSGLAFARAVGAGVLAAGQTVVLAGQVVSVAADARDADRLRLAVVPAIGAEPGRAPDQREIVISCRRDARIRTARGVPAGERLDGPGFLRLILRLPTLTAAATIDAQMRPQWPAPVGADRPLSARAAPLLRPRPAAMLAPRPGSTLVQ